MAITLIQQPQLISPVYNPIPFVVDSDNKNEDNFNYIFDLYESDGVTLGDKLIRVRVAGEPITGYGIFNPQKVLQSYIDNTFTPDLTGCTTPDYVEYTIEVGEAYTFDWNFTGNIGVAVTGSTFLLNVQLTGTTIHYYNVGDVINISNCPHIPYNGNWEVLNIPNNQSVTLDLGVSSLTSFSGTTKLFNDEQTFFTGLTTISGNTVHNAAIDTYDYIDYRNEGFVLDNYYPSVTGSTEFYTNAFEDYKVRLTNRGSFVTFQNVYQDYFHPNPDLLNVRTSDGGRFLIDLACTGNTIEVGVFPWNLNNTASGDITIINGTLPMIKNTTESYTVSLSRSGRNSVDIVQTYPSVVNTNVVADTYGTYNGANYFVWVDGTNTFYLWYDLPNLNWQVSNVLGGGNDYLISANSGTTLCPPLGQYGIEWFDGSNPLFTNFQTKDCFLTNIIQPFRIKLYEYCNKWDNFEFLFMDRKGSWLPMNFELVQRKNISINRKTFKKGLGLNYGYNDRGTTVVQNELSYRYTVVSNWFTEEQSLLFEEFMSSPEIFWNYKGEGIFIPINIIKLSEEIKDKKNSRLIQYTIEFEISNNPMVQTG
jgi:hypothetical protein